MSSNATGVGLPASRLESASEAPTAADGAGAPPDELPLPRAGELVAGRYRILRWIGGGGMGVVYEAVHEELGRRYAIKFLRRELASRSHALERFQREAKLLGGMSHDHVTQVFDFGRYRERSAYIVMEYLDGRTLREVLKQDGPLEPAAALTLMRQVCQAMAHAHDRGVVHRDLKPDNLMLTSASDQSVRVKILDFGIARYLELLDTRLTPTGSELGTCHYMSPEQARGEKTLDAATDVYSLGVIFYELISARRPHPGETYTAVMFHLLTQPPVPLEESMPSCPAAVRVVIERCLSGRSVDRYQNARELLQALEALREPALRGTRARPLDARLDTASNAPGRLAARPFSLGVATGAIAGALLTACAAWVVLGRGADTIAPALVDGKSPAGAQSGDDPLDGRATVLAREPGVESPALGAALPDRVAPPPSARITTTPGAPSARKAQPPAPRTLRASALEPPAPKEIQGAPPAPAPALSGPAFRFVDRNPYD